MHTRSKYLSGTRLFLMVWCAFLTVTCSSGETTQISGTLVDGFRIIPLPPRGEALALTVYRGDYIKITPDRHMDGAVLSIPALSVKAPLHADPGESAYFKMKSPGNYAFSIETGEGRLTHTGTLAVIEYQEPSYRALSNREAANIIKNTDPLILDVRTPAEYQKGHLKNALLIPVQVLQKRLNELEGHKNQDILIYCATGNRSTVASKILIDGGFKRIYNLRHGIVDWNRNKYPVSR